VWWVQELVQLQHNWRGYFQDYWNYLDLFADLCFIGGLAIRQYCSQTGLCHPNGGFVLWNCANSPAVSETCEPPQSVADGMCIEEQLFRGYKGYEVWAFGRHLYGLCCGVTWIRLLHIYEPNEALGSLVLAILGMFKDIKTFLYIIFFFVTGFGVMLHAGRTNTECPEGSDPHGLHAQCLSGWWFIRTYFMGFGEMSLDEIQDLISIVVLCICLLIVQLVLMNTAFVAVITSSFDDVMRLSRQVLPCSPARSCLALLALACPCPSLARRVSRVALLSGHCLTRRQRRDGVPPSRHAPALHTHRLNPQLNPGRSGCSRSTASRKTTSSATQPSPCPSMSSSTSCTRAGCFGERCNASSAPRSSTTRSSSTSARYTSEPYRPHKRALHK